MQVIIDRFEGNFAVVELPNRTMLNVPKELFTDVKEHDVVDITVNEQATKDRKNLINTRFSRLKKYC